MGPEVEAAIIAGGVGVLTVIAAFYGTRKTSRDTKDGLNKQLTEQREALDRTLKEQRDQLDKTLAEQRMRTLNERFATAAGQLGSDKPPAVRLAGVYAMAGLADDWEENRQTCVDVLCAYLRMPYEPDPGEEAPEPERLAFRADREVRHTVIRVITAHLRENAKPSWQGLNFDFTGVVFDGGDFGGAEFSGGEVSFDSAEFTGGSVSFDGARFSGGTVSFYSARFSGGEVRFDYTRFSGGSVSFGDTRFSGGTVSFAGARTWSHPPAFDWDGKPPFGVTLPPGAGIAPQQRGRR
jgi:Pentapeptide repeats (9 copies)